MATLEITPEMIKQRFADKGGWAADRVKKLSDAQLERICEDVVLDYALMEQLWVTFYGLLEHVYQWEIEQ